MNKLIKMILCETQKEIKMGDIIAINMENIFQEEVVHLKVNEINLPILIKLGYIILVEGKSKTEIPTDLNYYIKKLAKKKGCSQIIMNEYLEFIMNINKSCIFSILLREIALTIDEQYADHINESEEIYGISLSNCKIIKLNKKNIRNYKNFAAFRSIEDANIACDILKNLIKKMFK